MRPEYKPRFLHIPYMYSIYDCTDVDAPEIFEKNKNIIRTFTCILVHTRLLYEKIRTIHSNVYIVSPGHHSYSAVISNNYQIPNAVIFVGGISKRIDYSLLNNIVKKLRSIHFYFVGDIYLDRYYINQNEDIHSLRSWDNVKKNKNVFYIPPLSATHNSLQYYHYSESV